MIIIFCLKIMMCYFILFVDGVNDKVNPNLCFSRAESRFIFRTFQYNSNYLLIYYRKVILDCLLKGPVVIGFLLGILFELT